MADDQTGMTQDELDKLVRLQRLKAMEMEAREQLKQARALKRELDKILKRNRDQGGRAV